MTVRSRLSIWPGLYQHMQILQHSNSIQFNWKYFFFSLYAVVFSNGGNFLSSACIFSIGKIVLPILAMACHPSQTHTNHVCVDFNTTVRFCFLFCLPAVRGGNILDLINLSDVRFIFYDARIFSFDWVFWVCHINYGIFIIHSAL